MNRTITILTPRVISIQVLVVAGGNAIHHLIVRAIIKLSFEAEGMFGEWGSSEATAGDARPSIVKSCGTNRLRLYVNRTFTSAPFSR